MEMFLGSLSYLAYAFACARLAHLGIRNRARHRAGNEGRPKIRFAQIESTDEDEDTRWWAFIFEDIPESVPHRVRSRSEALDWIRHELDTGNVHRHDAAYMRIMVDLSDLPFNP